MIVFLGWSRSGKNYAKALRKFLLACFTMGVSVRISTEISKGDAWSDELFGQLKNANFGIMCQTPDSDSAWLCYEAGILTSVGTPVTALLFGVSEAFAPLSQKQTTPFAKEEVRKLTDAIRGKCAPNELDDWDLYKGNFKKAWSEFEETVRKLKEENRYSLTNFDADLKALLDPKHSGELGVWAAKRGEALTSVLNDNALPLLSKASELQAYMDELRKYESKNPLFAPLRSKLERLVL